MDVHTAYPPSWRTETPPLLASGEWHDAMAGRIEGKPYWFSIGAGPEFGIAGYVIADPEAYRFGNIGALLARSDAPFAPAGVAGRLKNIDAASLYPHLLLTYPGYSTFALGSDSMAAPGLSAVLTWAREQHMAAVALPYLATGVPLAEAAAEAGFTGFPMAADSCLDLPADGFDTYLAGLSKKRRNAIRSERKAMHARGVHGMIAKTITSDLLGQVAELRTAHQRKYGIHAEVAAEHRRIARVIDVLGERVSLVIARENASTRVVAFTMFVRDRTIWHALYTGVDDKEPGANGAYFETSFYAPAELGPPLGIRHVSYGLGADQAKRLRGCRAIAMESRLLGLVPDADHIVRRVAACWSPGT